MLISRSEVKINCGLHGHCNLSSGRVQRSEVTRRKNSQVSCLYGTVRIVTALYFYEGKWLFTREGLELLETKHCRSDSDDSSVLSVSLPESVPERSSEKMDSEISINPEDMVFDGTYGCGVHAYWLWQ